MKSQLSDPHLFAGGGNQKQQQAMISWSRLKKNHLDRHFEVTPGAWRFLVGFKVVKHDMTHHFNLKGQTSFHQSVKEGTWDFVSSNELTGSQVLLWLMSGTWSMWGFPPKPAGQLCPGSILTCLRRKKRGSIVSEVNLL